MTPQVIDGVSQQNAVVPYSTKQAESRALVQVKEAVEDEYKNVVGEIVMTFDDDKDDEIIK